MTSVQLLTNDDERIAGCRAGDRDAWNDVLQRYGRLVMSVALSVRLSDEDAADVTQATFLDLLRSLDRLQPDTRLGPWLATVARRKAWRMARRDQRAAPLDGDPIDDGAYIADLERDAWLREALTQLAPRCRELIHALYLANPELSYVEAAAQLDMSLGSVGPTRSRCLKQLRDILAAETLTDA